MIPLREASAMVISHCPPLEPRSLPIDEALGCVAGAAVVASEPIPSFVNSSRDGYALRASDTDIAGRSGPVRLRVVGSILAGSWFDGTVEQGQAARIMTGAPMPFGADSVCMLEDCQEVDDGRMVVIDAPVSEGTAVRRIGDDVVVGDVIVEAGTVLTPAHLGTLANQGLTEVMVYPRPRVGVLSSGDELVPGSGPLAPGQIRDANRHTLLALVRREGWEAVDLGIVGDDEEALGLALDGAALECDAVITSGGVSVGDLDIVKVVLEKKSGGTMRWMQVAIRPAKPFAFGKLSSLGTPVFGVPGNPVSAMVSFELLARPALRRMAGHRSLDRAVVPALADGDFYRQPDGKTHFLRAVVRLDEHGNWRVRKMGGQDSHQLRAMSDANALAVLPDGQGTGAERLVDVLLTDPDRIQADPVAVGGRSW